MTPSTSDWAALNGPYWTLTVSTVNHNHSLKVDSYPEWIRNGNENHRKMLPAVFLLANATELTMKTVENKPVISPLPSKRWQGDEVSRIRARRFRNREQFQDFSVSLPPPQAPPLLPACPPPCLPPCPPTRRHLAESRLEHLLLLNDLGNGTANNIRFEVGQMLPAVRKRTGRNRIAGQLPHGPGKESGLNSPLRHRRRQRRRRRRSRKITNLLNLLIITILCMANLLATTNPITPPPPPPPPPPPLARLS